MIGDEFQPPKARDFVQPIEQIGEPQFAAAGSIAVAVDGLAEERHFEAAAIGQAADLFFDLGRRAVLLRPANAGHDAVRAESVAAEGDPHHCLVRHAAHRGRAVDVERFETLADVFSRAGGTVEADFQQWFHDGGGLALPPSCKVIEQQRELAELAGADDEIDVRRPAENARLILLRHAAEYADD